MSEIEFWNHWMSDYKGLLKHSGNYLASTIATKALSFVSIPVYTSLLSVSDYGVFNVFLSTVDIAAVLLTLNSEVAVSRYFYDAKDETDFKRFVGTSSVLSFSIFAFLSLALVLLRGPFSQLLGFERLLTVAIIPMALFTILNNFFQQIYQPQMQSRKIAVVSCLQAYITFGLSVVFILLMKEKRYYGQVCGSIATMTLIGTYYITQIRKYAILCFDRKYLKYIFGYTLPYLPYSLSGIILIQFGKLIISNQEGFELAGQYSFASNIALLMMVLISVIHSAWNPYYFRYMDAKDYKSVDNDYDLLWRVTLVCGLLLSLFGYEIGAILGRPAYTPSLYLVPVLVLGYIFYQWSYVYIRNVAYAKKTIWNAIVVISSGIVNILLNSMLIGKYHELGVACSFSISYLFMLLLSWAVNKWILKVYAPPVRKFLLPLLITVPVLAFAIYMRRFPEFSFVVVLEKLAVAMVFSVILMFSFIRKWLQRRSHAQES